jgi:hypothetical protein
VDSNTFHFSILVPRGARFASTVREIAAQAARYANCSAADADRFAVKVESAVHACLGEDTPDRAIQIVVQRNMGPLEFLVDGRVIAVDP